MPGCQARGSSDLPAAALPTVACREVWTTYTAPGTFRALALAIWRWLAGKGFDFVPPPMASLAHFRVSSPARDRFVAQAGLRGCGWMPRRTRL